MVDTGDLFSPQELAKLSRRRWPMRGPGGRVVTGKNRKSSKSLREQHERDLAFQLATQERMHGMPQPARQYFWARELERRFCADFAFPVHRVLVEVQGGIWMPAGVGAHSGGTAIERDIEKAQYAAVLGWAWLPVTEKDIESGNALRVIQQTLERLGWVPRAGSR